MNVTLTRTSVEDVHVVKNMFVAYFYDMSQYDDNLIINDHGLPMWEPFGLPGPRTLGECVLFNWWIRDHCEHYIIRADGRPSGFVIILADKQYLTAGVDYELMDFYVTPKYRRQGVGWQAARAAFALHQGAWQLFELARNTPALLFWHRLLDDYTGGQYEDLDSNTQQRFRN